MRVRLNDGSIAISAETEAERNDLARWSAALDGHELHLTVQDGPTLLLRGIGPEDETRHKPINIAFGATLMPLRLISNLAETPFVFDNRPYASIEGFWQGLKHRDAADRQRIAALWGNAAKAAGLSVNPGDKLVYDRKEICVGTVEHWALMERACEAKFAQHDGAQAALLSTGTRPLQHKVKVDSRTIPGVIMADIWMRIRARLASA